MSSEGRPHVIRFNGYSYDLELGHLSRNGFKIRMSNQNARLLTYLIQKSGRLAAREELRVTLWPTDAPHDYEQAINKAISQIRSALRDDPASPIYIETIPLRGYRFCAQIQWPESPTFEAKPLPQVAESLPSSAPSASLPFEISPETVLQTSEPLATLLLHNRPFFNLRWLVATLVLIGVTALLSLSFAYRHYHPPQTAPQPVTLAFALIQPASPQAEELASSLRLDLIAGFSNSPHVKIIAATSSKGLKWDATLANEARRLGLNIVIFGDISRDGDIFHLRLNLVHAADGSSLASLKYSGPTSQLMQTRSQIALDIFTELQLANSEIANVGGTSNPLAYEAFLHGRYSLSKLTEADAATAVKDFKKATQLDPNFGNAYAALARSELYFVTNGHVEQSGDIYVEAQDAIDHALHINPAIAAAHSDQSIISTLRDRDLSRALQEAQTAVRLKPGEAAFHSHLSWTYSLLGNYAEAYKETALARSLDPYNIATDLNEINAVFGAGDCPRILTLSNKFVAVANDSTTPLIPAAWGFWACGHQEQAIATWRRIAVLNNDPTWVAKEDEGLKIWRKDGDKAYALMRLAAIKQDELLKRPQNEPYDDEEEVWDAIAGRDKEAMALVEKRIKEHNETFFMDALNPNMARLRQLPEFQALLHQVFR